MSDFPSFDGAEMHETLAECAGNCGTTYVLDELDARGLCDSCAAIAREDGGPPALPSATTYRVEKCSGSRGRAELSLRVFVGGVPAGRLLVPEEHSALIDIVAYTLAGNGATEKL